MPKHNRVKGTKIAFYAVLLILKTLIRPGPSKRLDGYPLTHTYRERDKDRERERDTERERSEERRVGKECRSRWTP